jgi:hypothetical protein
MRAQGLKPWCMGSVMRRPEGLLFHGGVKAIVWPEGLLFHGGVKAIVFLKACASTRGEGPCLA